MVTENADILTIIDPSTMVFIAESPIVSTQKFRIGQSGTVQFDALPDSSYPVTILSIGAESDSQSQRVEIILKFTLPVSRTATLKTDMLLFEFREFAVPVSILIITMLSLFGSFFALYISNVTLNISSFVGIILIIGIVAENAIFLIHTVKVLQEKESLELDEALIQACQKRTRPILMTTLGAVLAFLPLALGIGTGTQMQQPLAIAIIGGFSVSSFLLFFGLPLVYRLIKRRQ